MLGSHVRGQSFIRREAACKSTHTTHEGAAVEGASKPGGTGKVYGLLVKHAALKMESVYSVGPAFMSNGSRPEARVRAEMWDTRHTQLFAYYVVALNMFANKLKISQNLFNPSQDDRHFRLGEQSANKPTLGFQNTFGV